MFWSVGILFFGMGWTNHKKNQMNRQLVNRMAIMLEGRTHAAGINNDADSAINMWSEDHHPAAAPSLSDLCRPMTTMMVEMQRKFKKLLTPPPVPTKGYNTFHQ
jgi:hypothetical protein